MLTFFLDLLFPKRCLGCRQLGTYFCQNCIQNISQTDLLCPHCDRPAVGGQTHPACRRHYGLDGLWSLGSYKDPLRAIIKKLKYGYITELSTTLTDVLIEYWARYQPFLLDQIKKSRGQSWIVTPVPLHWYRQNSRGFNQSSQIASQFAHKLGLSYQELLIRTKYTKPQATLKGFDRRHNLKNAFILNSKFDIQNSKILLVDDVWTTGSTIKECCYILKRHGAQKVWSLTLAK